MWNSILVCEGYNLWHLCYLSGNVLLKVRKFQNENMKSSNCPKYERKKFEKFCPKYYKGRIFQIFFGSYFRQCHDFKFSFWNFLTFKIEQMQIKITTLTVSIPLRIESQVFLKSYFGFSKPLWILIRKHLLKFLGYEDSIPTLKNIWPQILPQISRMKKYNSARKSECAKM